MSDSMIVPGGSSRVKASLRPGLHHVWVRVFQGSPRPARNYDWGGRPRSPVWELVRCMAFVLAFWASLIVAYLVGAGRLG